MGGLEGGGAHGFSPKIFPIKKKRKAPEAPLKKTPLEARITLALKTMVALLLEMTCLTDMDKS